MNTQTQTDSAARQTRLTGLTARAFILGLIGTGLVSLWIHYAELVLGGARGHSALANTSIPVGAFNFLFALVAMNLLLRRLAPALALRQSELLIIYIMMTTATVFSSSGGLHFLIPTLAAAYHFATPENKWAALFHRYIPGWLAPGQKPGDLAALDRFYSGSPTVTLSAWLMPLAVWIGFLTVFSFATICIAAIVRRQWADRERLNFPTVALPLEITREQTDFWQNRLLWIGFAIPFAIGTLNTANLNIPAFPHIQVRPVDLSPYFVNKPWNSLGYTPISFYPFVIGIAYLISLDVTFSCWFFFMVTKAELIFGAVAGLRDTGQAGPLNDFPFLGHQGAGAFLAIVLISAWTGRAFLKDIFKTAFTREKIIDDREEPLPYRFALLGLLASFIVMVILCRAAGMSPVVAVVLLGLSLMYMTAATRVRAETGNAWLFGPEVDPYTLMTTTVGTSIYRPQDLTIMAFLRSISTYDLRCISMPHQLDGFKMADMTRARSRPLVLAMVAAIFLGLIASSWIALHVWYTYGAAAKCDPWRTLMGRQPFDLLTDNLSNPRRINPYGIAFVTIGAAVTAFLMAMRTQFVWWPFHPVGYAMANTFTMSQVWMPFFLAWLAKLIILRYGGMRLYRRSMPFFFGLILGDFINGGLWTLIGCFSQINVYPINW
ncbi:MAG: hypothetical protein IT210_01750 [Armatimonadetes bacterium]|nr:hypothetical protein [Armatimonadota bacterium]